MAVRKVVQMTNLSGFTLETFGPSRVGVGPLTESSFAPVALIRPGAIFLV